MPLDIDFGWSVDGKGYRLEDGRIIGNGGPKRRNRLKDFPTLYLIFGKIEQTPKGLLDFVNRFGRLTLDDIKDDRPIIGDDVRKVLGNVELISTMLEILGEHVGNPPTWQGGRFEIDIPKSVPGKLSGGKIIGGIPLPGTLTAALVPDPVTGAWQLRLQPPNLLNAIWLQFGQAITSNAELRTCAHCGKWFQAGQGSSRRAGAKFCSDKCRVEFNSLERSR